MKKRISRFSILQTSGVFALTYFFVSLVVYVVMTIVGFFQGGGVETLWLLLAPIPLSIVIYIAYLIILSFYNMVAGWIGGMEFNLVDAPEKGE